MTSQTIEYESVTMEVKGRYLPLVPARTNALPENCYPAEGGYIEDGEIFVGGQQIDHILSSPVQEDIFNLAWMTWSMER